MAISTNSGMGRFAKPLLIAGCLVAAVAAYLLWEEHDSHILGALFWLLLFACPAIHFFMHGKHSHGGHGSSDSDRPDHSERRAP